MHPFDTGFVFAEVRGTSAGSRGSEPGQLTDWFLLQVNSDVVFYHKDKYGNMTPYAVDTVHIGQRVCTKAIGSTSCEDITHTYKHPEGNLKLSSGSCRGSNLTRDLKGQSNGTCVIGAPQW